MRISVILDLPSDRSIFSTFVGGYKNIMSLHSLRKREANQKSKRITEEKVKKVEKLMGGVFFYLQLEFSFTYSGVSLLTVR